MKVGIMSMHRVMNWGSFLQAYALKRTVEKLGHECVFIDIKPGLGLTEQEVQQVKSSVVKLSFIGKIVRLFRGVLRLRPLSPYKAYIWSRKYKSNFYKKFWPMLGIDPFKYTYDQECDIAIIGSDEVFNCVQNSLTCRSMHLFGNGVKASKIISYAGSFGRTTIDSIEDLGLKERLIDSLSKLSDISVRDTYSSDNIKNLLGITPKLNVDPVLIYDFDDVVPVNVSESKYMVVYGYHNRINKPETIKRIKNFARKNKLKIISLCTYCWWCDKSIMSKTPFELLTFFKNADYVVTDTFHGTIFSIKYNKRFCTIIRNSNFQKISSLLMQFGLSDRSYQEGANLDSLLDRPIDYSSVNPIIEKEKNKAIFYLKTNIVKDKSQQ
jgi:hypothetical protein